MGSPDRLIGQSAEPQGHSTLGLRSRISNWWTNGHQADYQRYIDEFVERTFQKKHTRRDVLRLAGLGAVALPVMFTKLYPEATELELNLFATYLRKPDAPLPEKKETDPKIEKVVTLYNDMITRFGTYTDLLLDKPMSNNIFDAHYAMNWPYGRAIEAVKTMGFL